METEPLLVTREIMMTNYRTEDGSSSLTHGTVTTATDGGTDPEELISLPHHHLPLEKESTDKSNHNVLERFHEDALQQASLQTCQTKNPSSHSSMKVFQVLNSSFI